MLVTVPFVVRGLPVMHMCNPRVLVFVPEPGVLVVIMCVMVMVMPTLDIAEDEVPSQHLHRRGVYQHPGGDGGHDALHKQSFRCNNNENM